MKTRQRMLKVKIKSLAEEARIIRLEEKRSKPGGQLQCELHRHRVYDVRREQRHSLLAYAFIRGRSLESCERRSEFEPDWNRVKSLVEKFGTTDYTARNDQSVRLTEWRSVAVS